MTPDEIYAKVEKLMAKGQELDACWMATRLAPFAKSEPYVKAEALLIKYGISIKSPLESYTLRRMIELQNKVESQRGRGGAEPEPESYRNSKDAWNKELRVELITHGAYVYVIRSAGPDKTYFTDDDLIIGMRKNRRDKEVMPDMRKERDEKDSARKVGRRSLMSRPAGSNPSGAPGSVDGVDKDREVTLDELLKK